LDADSHQSSVLATARFKFGRWGSKSASTKKLINTSRNHEATITNAATLRQVVTDSVMANITVHIGCSCACRRPQNTTASTNNKPRAEWGGGLCISRPGTLNSSWRVQIERWERRKGCITHKGLIAADATFQPSFAGFLPGCGSFRLPGEISRSCSRRCACGSIDRAER
jgi:hypothetical protein